MSFVAYRSIYFNTTGANVEWTVEILDTTADTGQTLNFQSASAPQIKYAGLPQELKPGVYPTTYEIGMFIRGSFKTLNGVSYGQTVGFVEDLSNSPEGRFLLKLYKDGTVVFIGVILADQAKYEDLYPPYLLTIQAADGMYRWGTEDYVSEVGQIEYSTLQQSSHSNTLAYTPIPLSVGLVGTEWVMIEHYSHYRVDFNPDRVSSTAKTTYARYVQYQVGSPGDDWVEQAATGQWAKELEYFNEAIVDEDDLYHLTRDIDNTPFRTIEEYLRRAMEIIPSAPEYVGAMYDVVNAWYEHSMWETSDRDPFTMIRLSENKLATGKKWRAVLEDICRHFYCRLYYSDGRFHIEQISERSESTFKRYPYDFEGTALPMETVNLDLSYADLDIQAGNGGSYKYLAPLKNVKIKIALSGTNLMEGHKWDWDHQGSRYLGRIKKTESDTRLLLELRAQFICFFNTNIWLSLSPTLQELSTRQQFFINIQVRATNIETGITYYLTPSEVDNDSDDEATWETDATAGFFEKQLNAGTGFSIVLGSKVFTSLSNGLPGNIGESFDINVSFTFTAAFSVPSVAVIWTVHFPTAYYYTAKLDPLSLTTVDIDKEPVNANLEKIYEVINDRDNSLSIEMDASFCDTGLNDDSIEILSSEVPINWSKSTGWSRNATGTQRELLTLLAEEIMSLRTIPRLVFSGAFYTTLISTQNRLNRNSIMYLPLSCSMNTDVDEISGDFIDIRRLDPPNGDVVDVPIPQGPGLELEPSDDTQEQFEILVLETDEEITAASTLTECAIVNTTEAHVEATTIVMIMHPINAGEFDLVKLTEPILPDSTVMHFVSHEFDYSYPDASPIIPQTIIDDNNEDSPGLNNIFNFYREVFNGDTVSAPSFQFLDPEVWGDAVINKRYDVERGGIKIYHKAGASTPQEKIRSYYIDYVNKAFKLWIPSTGQSLKITCK